MEKLKESQKEERILKAALKDTVDRTVLLSIIFAGLFAAYGFTSIEFIQKFDPQVTMWANIWPRLLFNSLPLLLLGVFLKKSTFSDYNKLLVWIFCFSIIIHVASWIYVWPIALHKSPEIIIYVHAANSYLFALIFAGISPPGKLLWKFEAIFCVIFILPLLAVIYLGGDMVILKAVGNDVITLIVSLTLLSRTMEKLRYKIAQLEVEKELEATKFLGTIISKAIYNNEKDRLNHVRCKAYIISIDIRNSTDLQQMYKEKWLDFRLNYFKLASELVTKHGGYLQKTVGDCHVINFGVMDYGVDLSDIPNIEDDLARAEERRMRAASDMAFSFLDDLLGNFSNFAKQWFPEENVLLGAGIDKGWVERSVQGDGNNLELDVNGDPVNCSNRLQEYSKYILIKEKLNASVLVISPFAADFLQDLSALQYMKTDGNPVRNFANIPWVMVKTYKVSLASKKAA